MFADELIHTCNIQRSTPAQDSTGQPVDAWAALHTGKACRLVIRTERIAAPDRGHLNVTTYTLLLAANVEVTTKDQVSLVTLETGSTLGPFDILAVLPRRDETGVEHHRALSLEVVD